MLLRVRGNRTYKHDPDRQHISKTQRFCCHVLLPNIVVIFGDDIGWFTVSAYNMGMMGYRTPNIDRIAREGMLFTEFDEFFGDLYHLNAGV